MEAPGNRVWSVVFAPDGKSLAIGAETESEEGGRMSLWDVATGKLRYLWGQENCPFTVAFSPDGKTLASGGTGEVVNLWDLQTGQRKAELKADHVGLRGLAFSPDGNTLAGAAIDKTVRLWRVETAELQETLQGHDGPVGSVAFLPDSTLLTGSADETIRLWEIKRTHEK